MRQRCSAARIGQSRRISDLRGGSLPSPFRITGAAGARTVALLLVVYHAAAADSPSPAAGDSSAPVSAGTLSDSSGSVFSSLKQAFSEDFKREVVRGHFDVDSSSGTHRFYCMVDARTGKPEANGVAGDPYVRPDGMTGIRNGAVAPVSCAKAEEQGSLVTSAYVLKVTPQASIRPDALAHSAPAEPSAAAMPSPQSASRTETPRTLQGPDRIDVGGVRLGMSPDQVRAVLRSRMLSNYLESTELLGSVEAAGASARGNSGSRYLNAIAAWTAPDSDGEGGTVDDGESYEVMFTPVPGKERVMAVVHSVAYSPSRAIRTSALQRGLAAKYGGYAGAGGVTDSPTWRLQRDGVIAPGDACSRRGIFGGIAALLPQTAVSHNLALRTTPEEFHYQIERCGLAIITADQTAAAGDASAQDRLVVQYTVTAYSPSIAFDGATAAAQLIQAPTAPDAKTGGGSREASTPNL
jgi:hypothetical protein